MTDDARTSWHGRWRSVTLLVVAVACGATLQVRINYVQNEVLDDARRLATPVRELCADDDVAQQLGRTTCDRAAEVAARSSQPTSPLGAVGRVALTRLHRSSG